MPLLTAAECTAKANELEEKAETSPLLGESFRRMAAQWRDLARDAARYEKHSHIMADETPQTERRT